MKPENLPLGSMGSKKNAFKAKVRKYFAKLLNTVFVTFLAEKAAQKFRNEFPRLGLQRDEKLILSPSFVNAGFVEISGFSIPTFDYQVWIKDGWQSVKVVINSRNELDLIKENGDVIFLSFQDEKAIPIINILKSTVFGFPFTYFNVSTKEQIQAKTPKVIY